MRIPIHKLAIVTIDPRKSGHLGQACKVEIIGKVTMNYIVLNLSCLQ